MVEEAKEKIMNKIFWAYFHLIMFCVIFVIYMLAEIVRGGKEIHHSLKYSDNKKEDYIGETIMLLIIVIAIVSGGIYLLLNVILKNEVIVIWFVGVSGIIYAYIAIKQMIKMIFIPENRSFSILDIKDFAFTYMIWCFMVLAIYSKQLAIDVLREISSSYGDMVEIGVLFLWYYFNLLFAFEGLYILLYCLRKIGKKIIIKLSIDKKIRNVVNRIYDSQKSGKKYTGLKSFRLWRVNIERGITYKLLMTIPMLLLDVCKIIYLFAEIFAKMIFASVLVLILDPVRIICKYINTVWNRHKNNEWMYVFAQIAGLCSYVIVFLIIQYGEYEEVSKKVFEFAGTIILIPYFLGKITNLKKNLREDESEVSDEGEKKHVIPENMTYNADGEGVIGGKTIRQLEYEAMQYVAKNPQSVKLSNDKEFAKELKRMAGEEIRKKVSYFFEKNIEIIVGIGISLCMVCMYFVFRTPEVEQNISLIGSILGAEGAMISVLLTIAFTKKSNRNALDASVLPYLTIEKEKEALEGAYAVEYVKDMDKTRNFSFWRKFDFDTIRNDKIKQNRNGIAYLHIKNIGIGPAIHLKMKIENFSTVHLPVDYLRPNEEMYLVLNFNNPDESCQTDISFEYETIRGERHVQRFHANITWHLDRTNFTLFG